VLVCTTIIESGIDVPSANTIVIDRADKLGLAQLHQLRGRVGRSHHRAYAYLITPPPKAMTEDAKKRLEAIESLEDLGAGFTLATTTWRSGCGPGRRRLRPLRLHRERSAAVPGNCG
jgi:transcription-repair coupling factor (superfamily II helicase)